MDCQNLKILMWSIVINFIFPIRYLWDPMGNVHFAGENLSFAPGWIQGALESGLKSAYQVYVRHMERQK